jgi:aldehyde dehydrogenase (NAD+)
VNAGQICIAPDYVLVHQSKRDELVAAFLKNIEEFFQGDAAQSIDYTHMVNDRHAARMVKYLEDAAWKGATVKGGKSDASQNYVQPTIVTDIPLDSDLMQQEIFGPILPIVTYQSLDEAIKLINSKEKPLALYIYSKSDKNISNIINNTRAGGTCINHNALHFYNINLPFGGSNHSGIGKAHGFFGFEAFSNARSVYRQHIPGAIDLLTPPYTRWKEKLIELTVKFF